MKSTALAVGATTTSHLALVSNCNAEQESEDATLLSLFRKLQNKCEEIVEVSMKADEAHNRALAEYPLWPTGIMWRHVHTNEARQMDAHDIEKFYRTYSDVWDEEVAKPGHDRRLSELAQIRRQREEVDRRHRAEQFEEAFSNAVDERMDIEDEIEKLPATSILGIAIKLATARNWQRRIGLSVGEGHLPNCLSDATDEAAILAGIDISLSDSVSPSPNVFDPAYFDRECRKIGFEHTATLYTDGTSAVSEKFPDDPEPGAHDRRTELATYYSKFERRPAMKALINHLVGCGRAVLIKGEAKAFAHRS